MITLPLMMIVSLVGFFALIASITGTDRRSRGAHRA